MSPSHNTSQSTVIEPPSAAEPHPRSGAARPLSELLDAVADARLPGGMERVTIGGVTADSRRVRRGDLFVAVPGIATDGHAYIRDAVERGAAAVVVERNIDVEGISVIQVPDARCALAELAAEWNGRPADRLPLVGITGSLGKTSVLAMLEAVLEAAGRRIGTIGSFGIRFGETIEDTGHTAPAPLVLHHALARMARGGADLAAMEVTSHALAQKRVHGLRFALGIFTNLVPLEHMEYHGSFGAYAETKRAFFGHLLPNAPIVYPMGDRVLRQMVGEYAAPSVSMTFSNTADAAVRVERRGTDIDGSEIAITVCRPLPRLGGGQIKAMSFPLRLRLLGRPQAGNAALAATAALCLGVDPDSIRCALAAFPPPRRRMEIIHRGAFTVLDDTVGHPDSISAVFEVAGALPHRKLHVVYAIRGQRGNEINRRDADAIGIWATRTPLASFAVTSSIDAADERNRVEPNERDAFLAGLRGHGLPYEEWDRLADAVIFAIERAGPGDLVLLLGAQGMNEGAEVVRRWVAEG